MSWDIEAVALPLASSIQRCSVVAVLALTGLFESCDPCTAVTKERVLSPKGTKQVIVYERRCGVTTQDATHASVLSVGDTATRGWGNALRLSDDGNVRVEWISDSALRFHITPGRKIKMLQPRRVSVSVDTMSWMDENRRRR
jgi:hypothetical protein